MCVTRLVAACLLILASSAAIADDYFTGNDLEHILLDSGSSTDIAMFRGYVAGVRDIFNGKLFCVPDDVPPLKAAATVRKYLHEQSGTKDKAGKLVVINALKSSYACDK